VRIRLHAACLSPAAVMGLSHGFRKKRTGNCLPVLFQGAIELIWLPGIVLPGAIPCGH
jgi:hypothetical protein